MNKGLFITFEGIDGSGKTTIMHMLADWLKERGHDVVETREPGGTKIGQEIRKILLNPENKEIAPKCELLLFMADREQHVREVIKPALDADKIVLCDRYFDSMLAYQGQNILRSELEEIAYSVFFIKPDITFLLDLNIEMATIRLEKAGKSIKESRFDAQKWLYHEKIRECFLKRYKFNPDGRIKKISAENQPEEVLKDIITNKRFTELINARTLLQQR